jgi:hypothetical protein
MGYVKVHEQLLNSSIIEEDVITRWVWISLLLSCDRNGNIYGTDKALARKANVSDKDFARAFAVLKAPDPASTSQDQEGRRIIKIGSNLHHCVNYTHYRGLKDPAEQREEWRKRKARQRRREKGEEDGGDRDQTTTQRVRESGGEVAGEKVETSKSPAKKKASTRFVPPSLEEVRAYCESKGYSFDPEAFHAFYESKGWKVGKNPMKSWKAACVTWQKRREKDGPVNGNPASNHTQTPEGGEWVVYTYRQADLDEHGKKEDWSEYLDYAMGCEPETAEPYNTWRSSQ